MDPLAYAIQVRGGGSGSGLACNGVLVGLVDDIASPRSRRVQYSTGTESSSLKDHPRHCWSALQLHIGTFEGPSGYGAHEDMQNPASAQPLRGAPHPKYNQLLNALITSMVPHPHNIGNVSYSSSIPWNDVGYYIGMYIQGPDRRTVRRGRGWGGGRCIVVRYRYHYSTSPD